MACKFGHDEVVRILAAHPKTDKLLKNKYGEMPKDVRKRSVYFTCNSAFTVLWFSQNNIGSLTELTRSSVKAV